MNEADSHHYLLKFPWILKGGGSIHHKCTGKLMRTNPKVDREINEGRRK
jgi:hypothetical protein